MINEQLAESRGISAENKEEIIRAHRLLQLINENIGDYVSEIGYKRVAQMVEDLDYRLQELWGFPLDKAYHTYWYQINGCTCPKMDNQETLGTGRKWINQSCPFHGSM